MGNSNSSSSSSVQWVEQDEYFNFGKYGFDIRKAKEFIRSKPREVVAIEVSDVGEFVGEPGELFRIHVDWDKASEADVDLSVPIILAEFGETHLPIDGFHRIAKAKMMRVEKIPCVILTRKESQAVCDTKLPRKRTCK